MDVREHIPLSNYSTFKTGGNARFFISASSVADITSAIAFAKEKSLPWIILSGGSNILFDDEGFDGVVIHIAILGISLEKGEDNTFLMSAGAGEAWDSVVLYTTEHGLWGLENLSGIPGYVGASLVQNIGAYGAEVADVLESAEVLDAHTGKIHTITKKDCDFGYRHSMFQQHEHLIIIGVCFVLSTTGTPNLVYKDLAESNLSIDSSVTDVRDTVLAIRANKFPSLITHGTAGSFFKNPHIPKDVYETLQQQYPLIHGYREGDLIKVPLAWILDNVLNLKGYKEGNVCLYYKQPLVVVAENGATTHEVIALAKDVTKKVFDSTKIIIEPEVTLITRTHKTKNFLHDNVQKNL